MPSITIRAYGSLRDIFKTGFLQVSTQSTNVRELIFFLSENYDSTLKAKLIDEETRELHNSFRILINGRDIVSLKKLSTEILDGDEVVFFPPVSGG